MLCLASFLFTEMYVNCSELLGANVLSCPALGSDVLTVIVAEWALYLRTSCLVSLSTCSWAEGDPNYTCHVNENLVKSGSIWKPVNFGASVTFQRMLNICCNLTKV
jgi:hypothetical protein